MHVYEKKRIRGSTGYAYTQQSRQDSCERRLRDARATSTRSGFCDRTFFCLSFFLMFCVSIVRLAQHDTIREVPQGFNEDVQGHLSPSI